VLVIQININLYNIHGERLKILKIYGKFCQNPIREKVAILIILLVFCVNFVFFYTSDVYNYL